jgi:O-antigen ligase
MSKTLTSIFLGIYFFIYMVPQYINGVYYVYDRVTIQFLLLSVINLIVFIALLKNNSLGNIKTIYYKNSHMFSLVIFIFFAGLSVLVAINKIESIVVLANFITLFIAFISILKLSQNKKINFLKLFLFFSIIGIVLETVRTNFAIYDNVINNGNFLMRSLEFRGFTGNPNISSFSIVIKLPVVVFLIYTIKDISIKLIFSAIIISSILSVLLLFSRAALIAIVLIYISLLIYTLLNRTKTNLINLLLMFFAAYISFLTYDLANDKNTNDLLVERFSTVTDSEVDKSVNERLNFYKIAFEDIKNNPILGIGIGNWKLNSIQRANKFLEGYRIPYRTHNDFLELTAEVGIIGGLCFMYFIFYPFLFSFHKIRRAELFSSYHLIFLIVGVYIVDSMLNFPMHRPVITSYLFFAFALFHLNKNNHEN